MKSWVQILGLLICLASLARGGNVRVDTNFNVQVDGPVTAMEVQPDGKMLIGGFFNTVNGVSRQKVARLNSDGSVDPNFEVRGDVPTGYVRYLVLREGKIYASIRDEQGTRRYDSAGFLEFRYLTDAAIAVDSKRRVVFGQKTDPAFYPRLGRFTEDGEYDFSFDWPQVGCCQAQGVVAVAVQHDSGEDKILFGGDFGSIDGERHSGLGRLNENGSIDTNFVGGVESPVMALKLWRDGKFYTATEYTIVRRHLANGSVDPDFVPFHLGGPSAAIVQEILPEKSGSVIIFGYNCPGFCKAIVRRYNTDGTQDTNFSVAVNGPMWAVAFQPDGGILVGGEFTEVNCIARPYLARLIPSDTPDPLPCVPPPPPPPKPEPELTLTRLRLAKMVCCWPTNYPEYTLQATRRLRPNHPEKEKWLSVTNTPVASETSLCVTNRIARWGRHYRLVKE